MPPRRCLSLIARLAWLGVLGLAVAALAQAAPESAAQVQSPQQRQPVQASAPRPKEGRAAADPELIRRGEYLARVGDCVACHTRPGGEPFAGGLRIGTPLGDIVSTNITPSPSSGIGNYSLEEFDRAVREGKRADGAHLYPAMPYTSYAKVSDEDVAAMYAYFMHGIEPVHRRPPPTELPFPFNIRFNMVVWNTLFFDDERFAPDPSQSEQWNRGAYLVQGLTHCGSCHTPRNMLLAEDAAQALSGGAVGVWHAQNITSDRNAGVGGWSVDELIAYLKHGSTAKSQAAGPMAEAVDHSFQYLSEADLRAIAVYLKTMPALGEAGVDEPVYGWGRPADGLSEVRGVPWPQDPQQLSGPQLYDAYCAACHREDGRGTPDGRLPRLFQNTATGRLNTNNLVMVILEGIHRVSQGYEIRMPGFAHELSDRQVATLSNYLLQTYGNPKAEVSERQVAALREGDSSPVDLVLLTRVGMAAAVLALVALAVWLLRRRRRR